MSHVDDPAGSLREANIASRRQRILDAARSLIAKGGMAQLTMRAVAREAGLSVTTLYNLIGSREKIVAAIVGGAIDRMDAVLRREAPLDDPLERCRAIVTVSIAYTIENEALFRPLALSLAEVVSGPAPGERRISNRASGMQSLAIREAIAQGLLLDRLDPDVLGAQIYHVWEGAFLQWGRGLLDESGFRARALYGLYVTLLGVASPALRPTLEERLRALERELRPARDRPSGR